MNLIVDKWHHFYHTMPFEVTTMQLLSGPIFTRYLKKINSVKEGEMVVRGLWGEET